MGGFCGGGSSSTSSRSAGRGSGRGKSATQTVKSAASSLATDLKMGLSTFGQSKEQQAQTLRDQGYSERAITSYQERTAASMARALEEEKRLSKSDKSPAPAPAPEPEPEPEPEVEVTPEPEITPPPAPPPVGDTSVSYDPGPAETAVIEKAEEKTGQAGTIKTSSKGLTTTAKTRRRRSMISGQELEEGLLN